MHFDTIIIGAGLSGAVVANTLAASGQSVKVLEKARGSGGRLSSKRLKLADQTPITVDLGCPDLMPRGDAFKGFLDEAATKGAVAKGEASDLFTPVPRSSALTRLTLGGVDTGYGSYVTEIVGTTHPIKPLVTAWQVSYQANEQLLVDTADRIVITAPPEQAIRLLPIGHSFKHFLVDVELLPQWVCVLAVKAGANGFGAPKAMAGSLVSKLAQLPELANVCLENAKPHRSYPNDTSVLTLHFSPEWTSVRIENGGAAILQAAHEIVKQYAPEGAEVQALHVHRWLYSQPGKSPLADNDYLYDASGIALCGDYFGSAGVPGAERAFLSASALSGAILEGSIAPKLRGDNAGLASDETRYA